MEDATGVPSGAGVGAFESDAFPLPLPAGEAGASAFLTSVVGVWALVSVSEDSRISLRRSGDAARVTTKLGLPPDLRLLSPGLLEGGIARMRGGRWFGSHWQTWMYCDLVQSSFDSGLIDVEW